MDGVWLKGNLHTHTSDHSPCGRVQLERVVELYEKNDYDFLAISDHQHCTEVNIPTEMVFLPGIEWNSRSGEQDVQTVNYKDHLGIYSTDPQLLQDTTTHLTAREAGFSLQGTESLIVMNHPNWLVPHHYSEEELFNLYHLVQGVEIYNAVIEHHPGAEDATMKWDRVLTEKGPILGFASDDSHREEDIGKAWIMVNVHQVNAANILLSILAGSFYCSTGVEIHDIGLDGDSIYCLADKDVQIDAIGENGQVLVSGSRELRINRNDLNSTYVRFSLYGVGKQRAWSQPFFSISPL